jgi:small subunit ribosomal protein S18
MVRVLVRPCASALSALSLNGAVKSVVVRAGAQQALLVAGRNHATSPNSSVVGVRMFSSKKDKKGVEKRSLSDKFDEDPDITAIPAEVQYLSEEELKALDEDEDEYDEEDFVAEDLVDVDEDDDDEDDEDDEVSAEEWAENFEREVAEWDQEEGEGGAAEAGELEDDRLYIEMPGYDASLSLAEGGGVENSDNAGPDPFSDWNQGNAVTPEMLNWMLPAEKRRPFAKGKDKPWKYFVDANHPDVVELALDVDLLRLFISPTGRIRPRRFTGLTAKQQRKLAQAVKISRQLALLPYLSRYPEPSPEQWKAMEEEDIAKMMAEIANSDGKDEEVDDEDFDEDMEYD